MQHNSKCQNYLLKITIKLLGVLLMHTCTREWVELKLYSLFSPYSLPILFIL